jgi:hypothetical protein
MPTIKSSIDEKHLTKGELRKLNALRKSIGPELAEEAFLKWYDRQSKGDASNDPNIEKFEEALNPLVNEVRIPRGSAYAVRRGRGRFIVEPIELKG